MRLLKALWLWLQAFGALVVACALAWLLASSFLHLKLLDVQTGSMRPSFSPGDALVMQQMHGSPQVGQIVSYHSSRNPNELVTHRVVAVDPSRGFQTKGDALSSPDPMVRSSLLAGHVVAVLPGLGRLLSWIQSRQGLVGCVYLPALAVAIGELVRLERRYAQHRTYRLRQSVVS